MSLGYRNAQERSFVLSLRRKDLPIDLIESMLELHRADVAMAWWRKIAVTVIGIGVAAYMINENMQLDGPSLCAEHYFALQNPEGHRSQLRRKGLRKVAWSGTD